MVWGLRPATVRNIAYVQGQLQRMKKPQQIRGLNQNHNHEMRRDLQGSGNPSQLWGGVARLLYGLAGEGHETRDGASHLSPKDRAIALTLWKKEERFEHRCMNRSSGDQQLHPYPCRTLLRSRR